MKELKRSPLRQRLDEEDLTKANLAGVLRLAAALGIETKFRPGESEKSFRRRIARAILRWEKLYARGASV